jgi:hypothetical protein
VVAVIRGAAFMRALMTGDLAQSLEDQGVVRFGVRNWVSQSLAMPILNHPRPADTIANPGRTVALVITWILLVR